MKMLSDSTSRRLDQVPVVLAVQDTTEINWTSHPATTGLGPLGHTACRGLHVHSTLAFTPDRVPLGLFAQHVWARDPDDAGKRQRRKQVPIKGSGQNDVKMSAKTEFIGV